MRKTLFRIASAFLLCAVLIFTSGCRADADVRDILAAALGSQTSLPDGTVYSTYEDAEHRLDGELAAVIWGNGAAHPAYALTGAAAVFLPTRRLPFEMAVLECISTDSASDVALMCCERADTVARAWGEEKSNYSVIVCGRYVIAVFCADPAAAQSAAEARIRKG